MNDAKELDFNVIEVYETFTEQEKSKLYLLVGYLTNVLEHRAAGRKADGDFYEEKFLKLQKSFLPTLTLAKRKAAKEILAEVQKQNGR